MERSSRQKVCRSLAGKAQQKESSVSVDRGHVEHDPFCQTPLNEHTGTEPCLVYVTDDDAEISVPIAHYTQGSQGNQIADYYADYVAIYGTADKQRQLGSL